MNYIFDVDGTLWDTTAQVAAAWNDAIEDVGLEDTLGRFVTADKLKAEFGKPMDEIVDDLFPNQDDSMREYIMERVKVHEQSCVENCDAPLAYPHVVDTIRELAKRNKLFIVSNCQDGYITLVMDKLGIRDCISDYECFGATRLLKADNIKLVISRNGLKSSETYYVGDTAGDCESAYEAGIGCIYADYGFGGSNPPLKHGERVIDDFARLLDL